MEKEVKKLNKKRFDWLRALLRELSDALEGRQNILSNLGEVNQIIKYRAEKVKEFVKELYAAEDDENAIECLEYFEELAGDIIKNIDIVEEATGEVWVTIIKDYAVETEPKEDSLLEELDEIVEKREAREK